MVLTLCSFLGWNNCPLTLKVRRRLGSFLVITPTLLEKGFFWTPMYNYIQ